MLLYHTSRRWKQTDPKGQRTMWRPPGSLPQWQLELRRWQQVGPQHRGGSVSEHSLRWASVRASNLHATHRPEHEDGVAERNEMPRHRGPAVGVSQPGMGGQQVQQGHHEVDQMFKWDQNSPPASHTWHASTSLHLSAKAFIFFLCASKCLSVAANMFQLNVQHKTTISSGEMTERVAPLIKIYNRLATIRLMAQKKKKLP